MTKQTDDLQAVRTLVEILEPFAPDDRERIIRWAREKLGMAGPLAADTSHQPAATAASTPGAHAAHTSGPRASKDIRSFLGEKDPKSDRQLAAAVAYYYAFEAPSDEQQDSVGSQDLIDACRKAGRRRPTNSGQTLRNAAHAGYLDKAADAGRYKLNSVGENLVAMVLPGGGAEPNKPRRGRRKRNQDDGALGRKAKR